MDTATAKTWRLEAKSSGLRLALIAGVSLIFYALLWPATTGDMRAFLVPWLETILERGQVGAFSTPFANYTPPYLYLLAIVSPLAALVPKISLIKALSLAGTALLALAARHLLRAAGSDQVTEAMLWLVLLPSIAVNAAGLGQCDAFWSAACVMAVAAALERRPTAMLVWFGVAIAFKAQAMFLAPFVAQRLLVMRSPLRLWAVPPLVYALAMAPAALAGWPPADLFAVYLRQAAWNPEFISNAANPWALVQLAAPQSGIGWMWVGHVASLAAAAAYLLAYRRVDGGPKQLLALALLSALLLPFLLPKMHERFFFLADVLAFLLAFVRRDRWSWMVFALVETASVAALVGVLFNALLAPVAGSVMIAAAIILLVRELSTAARVTGPVVARYTPAGA